MDGVKKNFGFGCMRLPMIGEDVDIEQTNKMVDTYLEQGFNYFDTAHGYIQGKSEKALKTCLTDRYSRDKYILTNKLTNFFFKKEEDIRPFFEQQLETCGVDYFDYYLMHAQGAENFKFFKQCRAYETAFELKKEGKVKHVGISFHDKAEVLEDLHGGSPASYAIRFAAGFDGIEMVLSGMSSMEQMQDNLSYMKDFQPLSDKELDVVHKVTEIIRSAHLIPCTACRYCVDGCPKKISIPDLFACMNTKQIYHDWNADYYYNVVHTADGKGKASDCIKCGKCEKACPQHLEIRKLLEDVTAEFEKKEEK